MRIFLQMICMQFRIPIGIESELAHLVIFKIIDVKNEIYYIRFANAAYVIWEKNLVYYFPLLIKGK
ncbi:hypothetical protein B7492_06220 [Bacillus mycoides]|uniref:Uncharacterized protein n=1 Tax=Bacillus mycoides TaxID=1405 RepID=A0A1W6A517_BACMY|nr:hypothetical protein B7492_06220 [Bacillus mycoides]TKI84706.1 hypothetical protein FC701_13005 [Bacillus mycoides]